jgi:hypothetical protein
MREYPNVWPEGGLFAFSGVDGPTNHTHPFVARGLYKSVGWLLDLTPALIVAPSVGDRRCRPRMSRKDYYFGDCWRGSLRAGDFKGMTIGAFIDNSSIAMRLAFPDLPDDVYPELLFDCPSEMRGNTAIVEGDGWWVALGISKPSLDRTYGLAISYKSADEAKDRARSALSAKLNRFVARRLEHVVEAPIPEGLVGDQRRVYMKALSIQKAHVESAQGDVTHPWTATHRGAGAALGLWDTAFHAVAWRHTRPAIAEHVIQAILSKQRQNGLVPQRVQPGVPADGSGEVHPPFLTWASWKVFDTSGRGEFVEICYPKLVHYLDWYENNRKNKNGLYGWRLRKKDDAVKGNRGAESGMGNSPRFDDVEGSTSADLSSYMAAEYSNLEKLARALGQHDDADAWKARHRKIAKRINKLLWDEGDRFYFDLDQEGNIIDTKTVSGLMPLHAGIPDRDQAEGLRLHITQALEFTPYLGACTTSCDEPEYSDDLWRGPTWIKINLILFHALMSYSFVEEGLALAKTSIQEITRWYKSHGCFYEFYDPNGDTPPFELSRHGVKGKGQNGAAAAREDDHATAAAYLDLVRHLS